MGVTKEGERLNLGFSCYALKCSYILNLLSDDDLKREQKQNAFMVCSSNYKNK